MKHINNSDRAKISLADDFPALKNDLHRRLRNAVLALALSDKNWMIWLEEEIDPETMLFESMLQLIESRARAITLKSYGYLGNYHISEFIFRDWPFTDSGDLSHG